MFEKEDKYPALYSLEQKRYYYLFKPRTPLYYVDQRFEHHDFTIENHTLHAPKPGQAGLMIGKQWKDIHYASPGHTAVLRDGDVISFGYKHYEYKSRVPLVTQDIPLTLWDHTLLESIARTLGYNTKATRDWIFFWNTSWYHERCHQVSKQCYDHGATLTKGKDALAKGDRLPITCKDYFKSFIRAKIRALPSALYTLLQTANTIRFTKEEKQALRAPRTAQRWPIYGKILNCHKHTKVLPEQDRIVLYHTAHEHLHKMASELGKKHELWLCHDPESKTRYAMKLGSHLHYRNGGSALRDIAKLLGKENDYFKGPNLAYYNEKKIKR